MSALFLNLRGVYFDEIVAGTKTEEFRLRSPYWIRRIEGRTYEHVVLIRGYSTGRRHVVPWRGFTVRTITHPHFGPDPVEVFAIEVRNG